MFVQSNLTRTCVVASENIYNTHINYFKYNHEICLSTTPSCYALSIHASQLKYKTLPAMSRSPYITPDHSSVQFPGTFNDAGYKNYGEEYCGEDNYKDFYYEENY